MILLYLVEWKVFENESLCVSVCLFFSKTHNFAINDTRGFNCFERVKSLIEFPS